jgi:hypothetical protein
VNSFRTRLSFRILFLSLFFLTPGMADPHSPTLPPSGGSASDPGRPQGNDVTSKLVPSETVIRRYEPDSLFFSAEDSASGGRQLCGGVAKKDKDTKVCLGGGDDIIVTTQINISTTPITPGRSCAEAPAYSVTALSPSGATLSTAPPAGCLVPGDEILLIHLQGTSTSQANIGRWELLTVQNLSGKDLTFAGAKQNFYGQGTGDDTGIGVAANQQKVNIVRVARFSGLTIKSTGGITANSWNGLVGGVIPLKASRLQVEGSIVGSRLGYRSAWWWQDTYVCSNNMTTPFGESIGGDSVQFGGGGNILAANNISFWGNRPCVPGSAHAEAGEPGKMANGRVLGPPGQPYGQPDGSLLTMGSGAGGNLTCAGAPAPAQKTSLFPGGGGVVLLMAGKLVVSSSGSVRSDGWTYDGTSAAGGYIYLKGQDMSLGTGRISAIGGVSAAVDNGCFARSGSGYIFVDSPTVAGTTTPAYSSPH